jgi:carbamoyltransferase
MYILGISAFYHDSAAALISNGEIVAAAQEERFTRTKHDAAFPTNAVSYVLDAAKIKLADVDAIVFYDKPLLKFERLLETYTAISPRGFNSFRTAIPIWLREKLFLKDLVTKKLRDFDEKFTEDRVMFSEHHLSHAASAYYPSPFQKAVVLTLDGVGEWATTSIAIGDGNNLDIVRELHFPHSLGLLYSAFTYYTGFKVNSGEYKLMGLAPYGEPIYKDLILDHLIDLKEDGSFWLNQDYFNYTSGLTMISSRFSNLFGEPARQPEAGELTQFHMNIAASIQAVTEEVVLRITRQLESEYNIGNLCLAGGVALNCVANGKILRDRAFENLWIQPAAGDAGGALGAAMAYWHLELNQPRICTGEDRMQGSFLGPSYTDDQIEHALVEAGAVFERHTTSEMIEECANALADNQAVGWFQGCMEFGPRSLGNRSILGNPRNEETQKNLNLKIKFRESFRPFAPSVLREQVEDWFELSVDSPYMLIVADVLGGRRLEVGKDDENQFGIEKLNVKRSQIPAVTHVDYSARVQTVSKETNLLYHKLISRFQDLTDCPIVVNTSFNVRGEPIVCTPTDAFNCFMGTGLDLLAIGSYILRKDAQDQSLISDYRDMYELD